MKTAIVKFPLNVYNSFISDDLVERAKAWKSHGSILKDLEKNNINYIITPKGVEIDVIDKDKFENGIKCFYIHVGNMPPNKAEKYLEEIKNKINCPGAFFFAIDNNGRGSRLEVV